MSISSILGGGDDRRHEESPRVAAVNPSLTPNSMRPPSPGRSRSLSMRETMGHREQSPISGAIFGEPRAQSAFHDRPEPRRDGFFASPQFPRESPHSFRAFRPDQQEQRALTSGLGALGRPSSQPTELAAPRSVEEIIRHHEVPKEGRFGTFRHFGESAVLPSRSDAPRPEQLSLGHGVTSQPRDGDLFESPQMGREDRYGPQHLPLGPFGTAIREDQTGLFRPVYQHGTDATRDSTEARSVHDIRRDEPRSSPSLTDHTPYMRQRNGFMDRPITFEEHQRMERDQQRKESDGSTHRSLLGISPELNRKGRNSPLPQAVQGAQPRHVGPGGDNPGIKMEFGRMFSGLGSGVGSNTPTAGQSVKGSPTPSRLSPMRQTDDSDLVRATVAGIEGDRYTMKAKGGRKNDRRSGDEEKLEFDETATPDPQRGSKRAKSNHLTHHHHHHMHPHHHHHPSHESAEPQQGSFNTLRFPSEPGTTQSALQVSSHHHHHHHTTHAHPSHHHHHHHHHTPRSAPLPRKPKVSIVSKALLDQAACKPRKHLGSQLYTSEMRQPSNADLPLDAKIKFTSKMNAIPLFEGQENSTYTVRVPRFYLGASQEAGSDEPSALAAICNTRQLWGTDVYTDDSDVVAAAVHSGWLKGDFGGNNEDLHDLCDNESEVDCPLVHLSEVPLTLIGRPSRPVRPPPDFSDVHITLLMLPPLASYVSTTQHHLRSREWNGTHDGMSFMIHRIDFVDEGKINRFAERGIAARKQRIAFEEARRREAAAVLLMFANGAGAGAVSVGA